MAILAWCPVLVVDAGGERLCHSDSVGPSAPIQRRNTYAGSVTQCCFLPPVVGDVVVAAGANTPGDRFTQLGSVNETFVRSVADLQRRLTTIDTKPDPDGRYRVNEFCCADHTWQATVAELMERCDAVLMDLRGVTRERRGCEFELRQLAARVVTDRIVLVVDAHTDRALVRDAMGETANAVTFFELNDNRPGTTDTLFQSLLRAAR